MRLAVFGTGIAEPILCYDPAVTRIGPAKQPMGYTERNQSYVMIRLSPRFVLTGNE